MQKDHSLNDKDVKVENDVTPHEVRSCMHKLYTYKCLPYVQYEKLTHGYENIGTNVRCYR